MVIIDWLSESAYIVRMIRSWPRSVSAGIGLFAMLSFGAPVHAHQRDCNDPGVPLSVEESRLDFTLP